VLGGIAAFTVVDGGIVSPADLGNNFLVEASALGQRRAPAVTSALKELNENVAGNYVEEDPVSLLAARPDFFRTFTLVVATQVSIDIEVHLSPDVYAATVRGLPHYIHRLA